MNPCIVKQHLDSPHANPRVAEDEVRCHDCHGTKHNTMEDFAKAEMPTAEVCGEYHSKQMKPHNPGKHPLMEGSHDVATPWGFLGLRIPTKENVLALIEVAPSLEDS